MQALRTHWQEQVELAKCLSHADDKNPSSQPSSFQLAVRRATPETAAWVRSSKSSSTDSWTSVAADADSLAEKMAEDIMTKAKAEADKVLLEAGLCPRTASRGVQTKPVQ